MFVCVCAMNVPSLKKKKSDVFCNIINQANFIFTLIALCTLGYKDKMDESTQLNGLTSLPTKF